MHFVAVTGIILILFVIGHLLGIWQIFIGPDWNQRYRNTCAISGRCCGQFRLFLHRCVQHSHLRDDPHWAIENRRALAAAPNIAPALPSKQPSPRVHIGNDGLNRLAFIASSTSRISPFAKPMRRFALAEALILWAIMMCFR